VNRSETSAEPVDAELFACYAETDLDRWRQLGGAEVIHADERWGIGFVEDVRWGSCGANVPSTVQIRVRYAEHGRVTFTASSFAAHHCIVAVSAVTRSVIRDGIEGDLPEDERAAILERHDRDLREERDRRSLERAAELKRRAVRRETLDP